MFKNRLPVFAGGLYIPVAGVNPLAGFSSLIVNADSRDNSVTRSFCVRKTTRTRLMAGRNGGALALAGFVNASLLTPLRLATPFSSALARFEEPVNEAVTMAISARLQGRTPARLNLSRNSAQEVRHV
ncbi:hypothetical protein BSY44_22060 [Salmonella enterica subsp. enterica serovar Paratyphi B]|nr:hypothetical protein [Salmonella enterica subsp. enterica serovar Stanley]EDD4443463.1 hypothetical protein [Salmonella enterica subsp. enterica serovar Paratyphi B]MDJ7762907.1 hypothetical protein [Salmonella enterica]ECY5338921.1 hypothetical protein [Salmonella enterica subsp. enterica serovar Stanley]MDJ7790215.1 hypothetical protein [Salmonella enterica]